MSRSSTTAARVVDVEERAAQTQERLDALDEKEQALRASLQERRGLIAEVLAALQRIGRQTPPALMIRAEDALQSVRSAMMLGAVLPEMRHQAEVLAADLTELVRLRTQIADERGRLARDLLVLVDDRQRLSLFIDERQKRLSEAERTLGEERQHAAELAVQAENLNQLIVKLEQGLDSAARSARAAARAGEDKKGSGTRPDFAALKDPGRLTSCDFLCISQGNAANAGQWRPNPGIRRLGRPRRHGKGRIHRRPAGRPDHRSVRRMGGLCRSLPQLWPTLDP